MNSDKIWHERMYDMDFANASINSQHFLDLAKKESDFLITELQLTSGMALLDVPCGTGRHAKHFAKFGVDVTALDINSDLLSEAAKYCAGLNVKFENADMANLKKYHRRFDVTLNLFSSFGYFSSDSANERVLDELIATLKPSFYSAALAEIRGGHRKLSESLAQLCCDFKKGISLECRMFARCLQWARVFAKFE